MRGSLAKVFYLNPCGFVPSIGQGLVAKESQLGATGTKNWLKAIKLHKYWPLISHWSYWQMMSLTEDNIDYQTELTGGTGMTLGAKGKLLRCIQDLRERQTKLLTTVTSLQCNEIGLSQALDYISRVVKSPMPTSETEQLPTVVVYAVFKVVEHAWYKGIFLTEHTTILEIVYGIKTNPVLATAAVRLGSKARQFSSALKNHAKLTSMLATEVTHQQNMNCSVNSRFNDSFRTSSIPPDQFSIWPGGLNEIMFSLGDDTGYRPFHKHPSEYKTFRPNNISEDKDSFTSSITPLDYFSAWPWAINQGMSSLGDDTCYKPARKDPSVYRTFTTNNTSEDKYLDMKIAEMGNYMSRNLYL